MVKSIKKVHAQPKASGTIYQSSFYKAFTENWFLSAFNTVMLSMFDWFSLSAFNALKALLVCSVKQIKALRRVEVVAALLLMFPLVRQLFLAYLGFNTNGVLAWVVGSSSERSVVRRSLLDVLRAMQSSCWQLESLPVIMRRRLRASLRKRGRRLLCYPRNSRRKDQRAERR